MATEISALFMMSAVKMMGGSAREASRKKYRGILSSRFSHEHVSSPNVILEIEFEGDGYGGAQGLAGAVPAGKYAYVTMLNGSIRIWPTRGENGKDTDHPALCSFSQKVLYAGELWIDDDNMVSQWNNGSGTFHPKASLYAQAGLPLTKFVAHVPTSK
ncbi:MAG: hypothetical protein V4505_19435 [Pseudomonadota bacterium]